MKILIVLLVLVYLINGKTVPMLGLEQNVTVSSDGTVKNVKVYLTEFLGDYMKVQSKISKDELKRIVTTGLLSGIIKVEDKMKDHLSKMTTQFLKQFDASTPEEVMSTLFKLEQTMDRDKKSIAILSSALDYARTVRTYEEYVEDIQAIAREVSYLLLKKKKLRILNEFSFQNEIALIEQEKKKSMLKMVRQNKAINFENKTMTDIDIKMDLKKKVNEMLNSIDNHIKSIHSSVKRKARETIQYLKTEPDFYQTMEDKSNSIELDPIEHRSDDYQQVSNFKHF